MTRRSYIRAVGLNASAAHLHMQQPPEIHQCKKGSSATALELKNTMKLYLECDMYLFTAFDVMVY